MKKNDLHLGDDGEFTVDLDVSVKSAANIQKSKRQSEAKQKREPIIRMEIDMSHAESTNYPVEAGILAILLMMLSCFLAVAAALTGMLP
jgi:hypothetical protein